MGWTPEDNDKRRDRYQSDPEYREQRKAQGRSPEANREYMREYRRNNRDKWRRTPEQQARVNQRRRERYAADPEFRAECIRLAKLRDKESIRDYRLRREFGITAEEYDTILELQGDACAICRSKFGNELGHRLAVDHDHACCPGKRSCGKCIRGILCGSCNLGLGKFRDDPILLGKAIKYLLGQLDRP